MNENDIIRKSIRFYGRVQGVGFRYNARYSAMTLGLTGWVQNEWDGSVAMEVQGTDAQIHKLIALLKSERFISIKHIEEETIPTVESERKFRVR